MAEKLSEKKITPLEALKLLTVFCVFFILFFLVLVDIANISSMPCYGPLRPPSAASDQLKEAWNHTATLKTTLNVTFSPQQNNINVLSLAEASRVGIATEQICLSKGDLAETSFFQINEARTSINYTGSGNKDARISVLCYAGDRLVSVLTEMGTQMNPEWASDCPCIESTETCCLVALRFGMR